MLRISSPRAISREISSQDRILTQAAAISIPRGFPFTSSQMRTIEAYSSDAALNPTCARRARCRNNSTEVFCAIPAAEMLSGTGSPWTSNTHSSCNPRDSREVASSFTCAACWRISTKSSTTVSCCDSPTSKCSTLSTISNICFSRR